MTGGIIICGEAWGSDEKAQRRPFVGASGWELNSQLQSAGIDRSQCIVTNVVNDQPPKNEIEAWFANKTQGKKEKIPLLSGRYPREPILQGLRELQELIDREQPRLIIALGNTPLWAFTGEMGIIKWRGSIMEATGDGPIDGHGAKLIPTLHPAFILREYAFRIASITDLQRAKRESAFPEIRRPSWDFTVASSVAQTREWFEDCLFSLPEDQPIVADVENIIINGSLICIGFAVDKSRAICVPFIHRSGSDPDYWQSAEDEAEITALCIRALRERPIIFHNGLHDCQIIAHQWGIPVRFERDTMVGQHVLFPGMLGGKIDPISGRADKKGSSNSLSFCASIYCDYYRFWKDDGRQWDPAIHDERKYFEYNCEDCVRTFEVDEKERELLAQNNLLAAYDEKMSDFGPVFSMMFRGINFDREERWRQALSVNRQIRRIQHWIDEACGHVLNVDSTPQMRALFYGDFQIPPVLNRKTKQPTTDSKTGLPTIRKRRPLLRPLIERIEAIRSLNTFRENFLMIALSKIDKRLRASLNVVGTETMRYTSNVNAFGDGANLQNLPRMEE